ncbi:metallophosphoesterase [Methanogenium sp. S4BF]|uniref:metallophosphoesterase n=1 Tax=Methanogenium sp. S4BF TaxID=1789226 RepID=UPI002416C4D6|nr:metallophosphoesterase [Methanogenium sp. S4BF]WFN35289.1 metallophosphoesterase [Methanogenium sp. S4BF]
MTPEFIPGGPALLMKNRCRLLVIADAHFGAESGFSRNGVHIASNSNDRLSRICACIDETDPDLLLFLGDLKHSVPMMSRQEFAELPGILETIRKRIAFRLIPGNHDGGIERFLQEAELLPKSGAMLDGTWYVHGHMHLPPESAGNLIVCGHHHPVVSLYDEVGCALRAQPAYLLAEVKEACAGIVSHTGGRSTRILFMPAFFEYAGGIDVRTIHASRLSPVSRCFDTESAEVFLGDGTYIDRLGALMSDARA